MPLGPYPRGYGVHTLALQERVAPGGRLSLACGSYIPEAPNFVEVVDIDFTSPQPLGAGSVRLPHYFPPSRLRWLPASGTEADLLATSSDCVRIWSAKGELRQMLRHPSNPQRRCAPITALDVDASEGPARLVSCDVYGLCAWWDAERGAMLQAVELGQPLWDVAVGPDGLVAAAGEGGDCFLIDHRSTQNVSIFAPKEKVSGPARIAWGRHAKGLAVAWQGGQGSVVLYGATPARETVLPQVLPDAGLVADIAWSPAFPELLCCASEGGAVKLWQFSEGGLSTACASMQPCFAWEPGAGGIVGNEACTALALTPEVGPGQHALVLATVPRGVADPSPPASHLGALWLAALQPPARAPERLFGAPPEDAGRPAHAPPSHGPSHAGVPESMACGGSAPADAAGVGGGEGRGPDLGAAWGRRFVPATGP